MNFFSNFFGLKSESFNSYASFWNWFQKYEKGFFNSIKQGINIEEAFFDKLASKLKELKDGYFFLAGMYDERTVELVITADGKIKNIVFVEELINSAPQINCWKFTALKPALNIQDVCIEMAGYSFHDKNIGFYSNESWDFPDDIDLTIVHDDLTEANKPTVSNGCHIFLINYLGELDFANTVDDIDYIGKRDAKKEIIPIAKLKDFLNWRQKEFIEKYEGTWHDTENDTYSVFNAEQENGNTLIAVVNSDLLNWDNKASHPWILDIEIHYDGNDQNGLPNKKMYQFLDRIESEIMSELKDFDGYLNLGRQTANNVREIYFACKDFRKPSKTLHEVQLKYAKNIKIGFDIYKDKYWRALTRFNRPY